MTKKTVTFTYDLDDPETRQAVDNIMHADAMASAIDSIYSGVFKRYVKYGYNNHTEKEVELIEKLAEEVNLYFEEIR